MKVICCYRIDKAAGFAIDEDDNDAEAFLKVSANKIDTDKVLTEEQKTHASEGFKKVVANQLGVSPDFLHSITEKEYDDNTDD